LLTAGDNDDKGKGQAERQGEGKRHLYTTSTTTKQTRKMIGMPIHTLFNTLFSCHTPRHVTRGCAQAGSYSPSVFTQQQAKVKAE
jgi:hypothetical protein